MPNDDPLPQNSLGSGRILVVDDSATQRRFLRARLEAIGHEVIEAADGVSALAALRSHPVPVVLSDCSMAAMDGHDLCRAIRSHGEPRLVRDAYVILLSAADGQEEIARAYASGADEFLIKPPGDVILQARLAAGLRTAGLRRRLARSERNDPARREQPDAALAARLIGMFAGAPSGWRLGGAPSMAGNLGIIGEISTFDGALVLCTMAEATPIDLGTEAVIRLARILDRDGRLPDPAAALGALCREMRDPPPRICLVAMDPANGRSQFALAGHSGPRLVERDGTITELGTQGPPLGTYCETRPAAAEFHLAPGEWLLFEPDSASGARRPSETEAVLNEALAGRSISEATALLEHMRRPAVLYGRPDPMASALAPSETAASEAEKSAESLAHSSSAGSRPDRAASSSA